MKDTRILVEGSRGKSGMVKNLCDLIYLRGEDVVGKITGKETIVFREGKKIDIPRQGKSFLIDQENKRVISNYKDVKYKIFENQALSPYTMKVVHLVVKPEIIIIPNIRFEHQDSLGDNIEEIARGFAINFKGSRKVITLENKKEVIDIFREYCNKYKVELIVIDSSNEKIPSIKRVDFIDRVLKELGMKYLDKKEKTFLEQEVEDAMSIKFSKKQGISYFYGAKVNDIESTRNVLAYLKTKTNKKFVFVCYLRKDRNERTESFLPFFEEIKEDEKIETVYFTGSGLRHIKDNPKFLKDEKLRQEEVINYCKENNSILFTAINGVNDFMKELEKMLEN